jgi:hypothetical protein
MGYLRGAENDLSNFSKFVQKADTILKKLRVSSSKIKDKSEEPCKEREAEDAGDNDKKRKDSSNETPLILNRYITV